jgi:hypothetical protein
MVKSASFSVGTGDDGDKFGGYFITTTTAATVIVTLGACATTNAGRMLTFVKTDATTGDVRVTVSGGGLISGKWASLYLINQGDSLTVVSNGTLWYA